MCLTQGPQSHAVDRTRRRYFEAVGRLNATAGPFDGEHTLPIRYVLIVLMLSG